MSTCQLAVLMIIGQEIIKAGVCNLPIDAIAALAGTCRSVVQSTFRLVKGLGLAVVTERRRRGRRSLTNLVRVVSSKWLMWLRRRGGFKNSNTTHSVVESTEQSRGFGASWQRYFRHYDPGDRVYACKAVT
jgi:hypothetical protein